MFLCPDSGRKLTSQGQRNMDRIAGQVNYCHCVILISHDSYCIYPYKLWLSDTTIIVIYHDTTIIVIYHDTTIIVIYHDTKKLLIL